VNLDEMTAILLIMILTTAHLQSLAGREFVYSAKSLMYKVNLIFSYQFDENRFIAASHLEARSIGKIVYEESRSSRYFTQPQIQWSDFTQNGKILKPPSNAMDLCLLPAIFQLHLDTSVVAYVNDWKLWNVDISVDGIIVDTEKVKLEFKQSEDTFLKSIILHTKFAKNIRLERH
jgi:hypothetical protein